MTRLARRLYAALLAALLIMAALALGVYQYHAQAQREQEQAAWIDLAGGWAEPALQPLAEADAPPIQRLAWVGATLAGLLLVLAAAAYPVVRSLTRRLETLRDAVQAFGQGALQQRVPVQGDDEVADLARSFNAAAERIEALVQTQRQWLANASHELRSPLARLKLALELLDGADPDRAAHRRAEIARNIAELDALVEEILLAARLQAGEQAPLPMATVELVALTAEEVAASGAQLQTSPAELYVLGDERLLRRALRNLLDNAARYAPGVPAQVHLRAQVDAIEWWVCDRGPGVPEAQRQRVFEPFYRLPGHAEHAGGVGLGLSLVRQIAHAHGGSVRCEPHAGGGACFVLRLPRLGPGGCSASTQPSSRANASR